ncbi:amino acid permease [Amycolatopsis rubida]|uniref:Amino acid permease n=1 Tax=Amycolatopsis rubida TaxID=112413 RepID=A0ABX0C0K3_9PSEU|nr:MULTISPECIES: amino acid permease [Amycolatopsis]MYW96370.1 amino acid permease [Amycolatopsis rubida]NEC61357.1 amino acid permease [Amycolatopsis rubida]OAP22746.1 Aromatic amino acid transport protein AroP [Amycolatopsis sp. M39]
MESTVVAKEGDNYTKALGNRQVQMIAIGGAIGVGLFLGAGGRLHEAGPSLVLSYALCGIAAYFVMRALGELVLHQPSSGSFVTYARKFIGPWAGFVSGWTYWLNWAMTGIAEITAVAIYVHKWLPDVPQWITALVALGVLMAVNLLSVKLFGELEFWFSVVKVLAIIVFLVTALGLVFTGANIGGATAGVHNLTDHGGFFPAGVGIALMTLQAVVFAYSAIEVVGIAAGETKDARKVLPKAINGVVWRIGVFYVGSVLLLAMLMPWPFYNGGESPFVTVFSRLGIGGIGDVMNAVVLTAALSSCNSGLYSTGRILRALADEGEAPKFVGKMNSRHVPYGGILFTSVAYVLGVVLNYIVPSEAFDIATAIASLGVVATWATLVFSQMRMRQAALRGELERPGYRMPGAPYTGWATLGFLVLVVVLMGFSDGAEKIAFYSIPAIVVVLAVGWRLVSRKRQARTGT